jgi:hypothetical protein
MIGIIAYDHRPLQSPLASLQEMSTIALKYIYPRTDEDVSAFDVAMGLGLVSMAIMIMTKETYYPMAIHVN